MKSAVELAIAARHTGSRGARILASMGTSAKWGHQERDLMRHMFKHNQLQLCLSLLLVMMKLYALANFQLCCRMSSYMHSTNTTGHVFTDAFMLEKVSYFKTFGL